MKKARKSLRGELLLPGDKSISHRAVLLSSLARGKSRIRNILLAEDITMSRRLVESIGAEISDSGRELTVIGKGAAGMREPADILYAGNSGTTMRIGSGILAGIDGISIITGDRYLRERPMDRIITPLSKMGAMILGREKGRYPPLVIRGGNLRSIQYEMPVASAQVKSAILVAAAARGVDAEVREPLPTRDHTEKMLREMGADVSNESGWIKFSPADELKPLDLDIPSDFSSAAFFIVGAVITPSSDIVVRNVLVNPLRSGMLPVLKRMGANLRLTNRRCVSGEEAADLIVSASALKGTVIEASEVPLLIDEVPILAVAAAFAAGMTEIRGAGELRIKESDRITSVTSQLSRLGVSVKELPDGMIIEGGEGGFKGGKVSSFGDHRIAMSLEMFGVGAGVEIMVDDRDCVASSFPDFYEKLGGLLS